MEFKEKLWSGGTCSGGEWVISKPSFHLQGTQTDAFVLFKGERGESHNKQGECSVCVSAREKKGKRTQRHIKAEGGLCFRNPVWEVKPHLPRMPCLTPCSPLRVLGASLLLASLLYCLSISHLQLFSESWKGDLMWSSSRSLIAAAQTLPHTAPCVCFNSS